MKHIKDYEKQQLLKFAKWLSKHNYLNDVYYTDGEQELEEITNIYELNPDILVEDYLALTSYHRKIK